MAPREHAPHNAMDDADEIARFHDRCSPLMRELLGELAVAPGAPPLSTVAQPFTESFVGDPVRSSFGFAVRHMGVSTFRGRLDDARATLTREGDRYVLDGEANVESISIRQPEQFRDHVLGEEFF